MLDLDEKEVVFKASNKKHQKLYDHYVENFKQEPFFCLRLKKNVLSDEMKPDIGAKDIIDVSIALDLYELIKISFHSNAKINVKTFLNAICALTGAEPVSMADDEIVIYRRSLSDGIEHIEI